MQSCPQGSLEFIVGVPTAKWSININRKKVNIIGKVESETIWKTLKFLLWDLNSKNSHQELIDSFLYFSDSQLHCTHLRRIFCYFYNFLSYCLTTLISDNFIWLNLIICLSNKKHIFSSRFNGKNAKASFWALYGSSSG